MSSRWSTPLARRRSFLLARRFICYNASPMLSGRRSPPAPAPLPATIRLVQISIVARQLRNDQGLGEGQATAVNAGPVVVGDHNPSNPGDAGFNLATYQQIRRRVLIRTVDARNLGL